MLYKLSMMVDPLFVCRARPGKKRLKAMIPFLPWVEPPDQRISRAGTA